MVILDGSGVVVARMLWGMSECHVFSMDGFNGEFQVVIILY